MKLRKKAQESFGSLPMMGKIILAILILLAILAFLYKAGVFTGEFELFGK